METWHQNRLAINNIENIALQLGWMWREQPNLDYGIDGQIEICADDRRPTGRLFAVQSTCSQKEGTVIFIVGKMKSYDQTAKKPSTVLERISPARVSYRQIT